MSTLTLIMAAPWNPGRASNARALAEAAGDPARIVWDADHSASLTFAAVLSAQGDEPAIHLEDDVELCPLWRERAEEVIASRPGQVIQFFSTRPSDVGREPHDRPGRDFVNGQCWYLPGRLAGPLRELVAAEGPVPNGPGSLHDLAVARLLMARRERYWSSCRRWCSIFRGGR